MLNNQVQMVLYQSQVQRIVASLNEAFWGVLPLGGSISAPVMVIFDPKALVVN